MKTLLKKQRPSTILFFLLLIFISLFSSSCKKEECTDENSLNFGAEATCVYLEEMIVGEWESRVWTHAIDLGDNDPFVGPSPFTITYEFQDNGDFFYVILSDSAAEDDIPGKGVWRTINNNTLILDYDGEAVNWVIFTIYLDAIGGTVDTAQNEEFEAELNADFSILKLEGQFNGVLTTEMELSRRR